MEKEVLWICVYECHHLSPKTGSLLELWTHRIPFPYGINCVSLHPLSADLSLHSEIPLNKPKIDLFPLSGWPAILTVHSLETAPSYLFHESALGGGSPSY